MICYFCFFFKSKFIFLYTNPQYTIFASIFLLERRKEKVGLKLEVRKHDILTGPGLVEIGLRVHIPEKEGPAGRNYSTGPVHMGRAEYVVQGLFIFQGFLFN